MFVKIALLLSMTLIGFSCGEDEEGESIGAPAIKPPIERSMPAGFKSTSLKLADETDPIGEMKSYLYPTNGFVGPLERLALIDGRMAELNSRSEDSKRKCLGEDTVAYDVGGTLPGSMTFAQKYNCQEELGAPEGQGIKNQKMAFGIADDLLYLNEHRYDDDGSAIVVLVQAATAGTSTEIWDVRYTNTKNYVSSILLNPNTSAENTEDLEREIF